MKEKILLKRNATSISQANSTQACDLNVCTSGKFTSNVKHAGTRALQNKATMTHILGTVTSVMLILCFVLQ